MEGDDDEKFASAVVNAATAYVWNCTQSGDESGGLPKVAKSNEEPRQISNQPTQPFGHHQLKLKHT